MKRDATETRRGGKNAGALRNALVRTCALMLAVQFVLAFAGCALIGDRDGDESSAKGVKYDVVQVRPVSYYASNGKWSVNLTAADGTKLESYSHDVPDAIKKEERLGRRLRLFCF